MEKTAKCSCREAARHRDCAYCGSGWADGMVCGKCKLDGIDGKVIRGTEKRTCEKHKQERTDK